MRTTKRIIIRIIVAVLVAIILSKLRLLGIMNVSALEYYNKAPTNSTIFDYQYNGTNGGLINFQANRSTFYGFQFQQASANFSSASFNFDIPSGLSGKYTTLEFVAYANVNSKLIEPFNFYVRDYQDNISYCYVNSTTQQNTGTSTAVFPEVFSSVYCPRVILRGGSFQIYMANSFNAVSSTTPGTIGITQVTFKVLTDNEQIIEQQQQTNNKLEEQNNLLKDDNTSGASSEGSSFFNNFDNNNHGLTGVITAPLSFIQSLTSNSCTPLHLNLGIVNKEFDLPCATTFMRQHFSSLLNIYQTITFGVISYLILVNIFSIVKNAKDPDTDKIEVLQL